MSDTLILFSSYGDSVAGKCRLIVAVHSNTEENCTPIERKIPSLQAPHLIAWFLWTPFNKPELAILYSQDNSSFNNHTIIDTGLPPLVATIPSDTQRVSANPGVNTLYYFHRWDDNRSNPVSSAVISVDGICRSFTPIANINIFCHYFGIEFWHSWHTYVHTISPFKFVPCFCLSEEITYKLSHPSNAFCMDASVLALTSVHVFKHILECCLKTWSLNFENFQLNQYAAPAACVQAFLNGSIGVHLPVPKQWADTY